MSRILRRPMFRGGPVSSYGTGIAAPLVPGYQGGGQIGGGIIHGKPMADGRYGFADIDIDESTIGANVVEQAKEKVKTPISEADLLKITQEREYLEEPVKLTDEHIREQFDEAVLKNKRNIESGGMSETDLAYGMQIAMPVSGDDADFYKAIGQDKEGMYELWREGKSGLDDTNWNKAQADQEKKYDVNLSDRPDKETIDPDQKWKDKIAALEAHIAGGAEEKPEVDAKAMVAENKELFADLLGIDKARGTDISDMLLGFAGAEGDDTWSKFKAFTRDEAKRPGRRQKIEDAAGTLAIQDYIAGKRSKEQIEKLKEVETWKLDEQIKRIVPQADDKWITGVRKAAGKDGSLSSSKTLKSALAGIFEGKIPINQDQTKKTLDEISKDQDEFEIGFTIVTLSKENGKKVIVEKTATDIKIRTDLPIF